MIPCVLQLLVSLRVGGAERLALSIMEQGKGRVRGLAAGLFHPAGDLVPLAREAGLACAAIQAEGLSRLTAVRRLRALLREHKADVVHAQAAYLLPYALPACLLARVPLIYTEHATRSLETMPKLRLAVRLAAPFLRAITCVSEEVRGFLVNNVGLAPEKVRVIPNGVDTARFTPEGPASPLPWPEKDGVRPVVFGNVARLCEAKDHETLLRAFAIVQKENPEARLLLVGEGEKRRDLENLAASLEITDVTHLAGSCSDVPAILRGLDVFVLSSQREGMPMAVLEAMACAVPVISANVGDIARLNGPAENLLLVPPRDAPALAKAMLTLLQNPTMRRRLAENGLNRVRADYDGRNMADRYLHLYLPKGETS